MYSTKQKKTKTLKPISVEEEKALKEECIKGITFEDNLEEVYDYFEADGARRLKKVLETIKEQEAEEGEEINDEIVKERYNNIEGILEEKKDEKYDEDTRELKILYSETNGVCKDLIVDYLADLIAYEPTKASFIPDNFCSNSITNKSFGNLKSEELIFDPESNIKLLALPFTSKLILYTKQYEDNIDDLNNYIYSRNECPVVMVNDNNELEITGQELQHTSNEICGKCRFCKNILPIMVDEVFEMIDVILDECDNVEKYIEKTYYSKVGQDGKYMRFRDPNKLYKLELIKCVMNNIKHTRFWFNTKREQYYSNNNELSKKNRLNNLKIRVMRVRIDDGEYVEDSVSQYGRNIHHIRPITNIRYYQRECMKLYRRKSKKPDFKWGDIQYEAYRNYMYKMISEREKMDEILEQLKYNGSNYYDTVGKNEIIRNIVDRVGPVSEEALYKLTRYFTTCLMKSLFRKELDFESNYTTIFKYDYLCEWRDKILPPIVRVMVLSILRNRMKYLRRLMIQIDCEYSRINKRTRTSKKNKELFNSIFNDDINYEICAIDFD